MIAAGDAFARAVARAHMRAAVVRALAMWETWIVLSSALYLAARVLPWARAGFPVVGR